MDSPLTAASSKTGDEPSGPIAAMLANRNVHDRLYAGSGAEKGPRVKDAREAREAESRKPPKRLGAATEACLRLHSEGVEQKKEVLKKAKEKQDEEFREGHPFQPKTTQTPLWKAEKITGTRQEAWQRLQQSNSQKEISLKESREKLHQEFQDAHPFKPNVAISPKKLKFAPKPLPPTTREEWIQMQKDWQQKKLEKRSEKLRMKLEEEEKEVQEQNVHRNVEADAAAVCKRLHHQHARQQERQHKRRVEHFAEANENLNRLHRELDKTAVASQKVDQMVERLYILDRENRNERQQQRMKQKKKAEQAEELLLEALSVHTPPGVKSSYHHDQVSMRIAKELEALREQVAELQQRALRTDYKELVKQAKPKAASKSRSKSKEVTPRGARSVSPSYAALAAKAKGKPGSATAAPKRSPMRSPAPGRPVRPVQGRASRSASWRPKSVAARPAPKGASPSPRAKSPAKTVPKESKGGASPKARSKSKPAPSETRDSFADQVRAANDRRNSGSGSRGRSSSRSSRGKPLEPKRLRPPSTSSAGSGGGADGGSGGGGSGAGPTAEEVLTAAVKIQSCVRGKQARQEADRRRKAFGKARTETRYFDDESDGSNAREDKESGESQRDEETERQREAAATKIQSQVRGKQARLEADRRRQGLGPARSESKGGLEDDRSEDAEMVKKKSEHDDAEQAADGNHDQDLSEDEARREQAATKIQSRVRGNQVRRDMEAAQRGLQRAETRSEGSRCSQSRSPSRSDPERDERSDGSGDEGQGQGGDED